MRSRVEQRFVKRYARDLSAATVLRRTVVRRKELGYLLVIFFFGLEALVHQQQSCCWTRFSDWIR
jgi:hypothetical protein